MLFEITHLDELDSTNEYLKRIESNIAVEEQKAYVVYTDYQTNGRGAGTNKWFSNKGENLLCSFIFKPKVSPNEQFIISKITSLALIDLLAHFNIKASIKWPNDILVNKKKIAGILIENSIVATQIISCIIGVGLNVNQAFFDPVLNATSMHCQTKQNYNIRNVLDIFLNKFNTWYSYIEHKNILNSVYFKNLFGTDGFYQYKSKNDFFEAKIVDVDEQGTLKLRDENNNEFEFKFKEVELII